MKSRISYIKYYFFSTTIILLFHLAFFNRFFPLAEGWFETYGYLINKGLIPYNDFNLALPPLYLFINSIYLKLIGPNFFLLRVFGILLNLFILILLQFFLGGYFKKNIAYLSSMLAILLSISSCVYIAKDYHTIVDLILVLLLLISQKIYELKSANSLYNYSIWFLMGFILLLLTLTKQNIGVCVFLSYFICIISYSDYSCKQKLFNSIFYFLGFFLLLYTIAFYYGKINQVPLNSFFNFLVDNDSKGSLIVLLTRFILDPYNFKILSISFLFLLIYYYSLKINSYLNSHDYDLIKFIRKININYIYSSFGIFLSIIVYFSIFEENIVNSIYQNSIIPFSLCILMILTQKVYHSKQDTHRISCYHFIVFPLITIAYCNTHTAGFNFTGMIFIIAFTSCFFLSKLLKKLPSIKPIYIYSVFLLITFSIIIGKFSFPYNWWGYKQSSIFKANKSMPYPQLRGLFVDGATQDVFTLIKDAVDTYSLNDHDCYFYPNIPIFYLLHDKVPPYKNVVQWFDVISSKNMKDELRMLKANPPNLIVSLDLPIAVYQGHFKLIKRPLIQEQVDKEFKRMLRSGSYDLKVFYIIDSDRNDKKYLGDVVKEKVVVTNNNFINKPVSSINRELYNIESLIIHELIRNNVSIKQINDALILRKNDVLVVSIDAYEMKNFVEKIGYTQDNKYYSIKILKRNDI